MEKLDHKLGAMHKGIVDVLSNDHTAQGNHAIGHRFGKGDHVGHDIEALGSEVRAQATKAGNHFIKN